MSGTRVSVISAPLIAPIPRPMKRISGTTRKAYSSLAPSIMVAEATLVSAIIEAMERSTPPAITTTVWAAAANPKGSAALASEPNPAGP
jgi:hypothetical protein